MSDHYKTRCPSCGSSDEQGCYADCPTATITTLRAEIERLWELCNQSECEALANATEVERLRAALQWIDQQRYTDRNTISHDNAFEMACKMNKLLVEIMDRARAELEEKT